MKVKGDPYTMKIEKAIYNAYAKSTGGREGHTHSSSGALSAKLSTPGALGGAGGDGTNPEELFAAGYSACFLGALKHVSIEEGVKLGASPSVSARVGIGTLPTGFGLEVDLNVELPGVDTQLAQKLVELAHLVCPYSNATRDNINVNTMII